MARTCDKCGALVNGNFCEYCGADYSDEKRPQTVVVNYYINEDENKSTPDPVSTATPYDTRYTMPVSKKSRFVAFMLCLFLGPLGAHYFYVSKPFMGILYICTFGLFGIGWIVDLVRIISGSFTDRGGIPLSRLSAEPIYQKWWIWLIAYFCIMSLFMYGAGVY